jgi:predicted methyltransferase|tara:strand:- start:8410 stop:9147 length:738 start_codon:yes stop_codon:yes gene_type:complete
MQLHKCLYFIITVTSLQLQAAEHLTSSETTQALLKGFIDSNSRSQALKSRNRYRHPLATLTFFGLEREMTVIEIWPGGQGGWYRSILEPFLQDEGSYIPVRSRSRFPLETTSTQADMVLVFRAHGFMIYDHSPEVYFSALYRMVKPGGIFGIVDHRGNEAVPQDPEGRNGYVNQSHVVKLAEAAGFHLLAESEVNANPKDRKDHPYGLYSLPPTLQGSRNDPDTRQKFLAIGESDRMTLKFYKPE